ncbi:MAG: SCP2 sterol-binding domain-containing protein [Gallionellaceae bacterium]|nr:SCP2 sterol-binding domain-containing protein [Gallionellaceae bacterium]
MQLMKLPKISLPRLSAGLPTLPLSAAFVTMFNLAAWRALKDMDWASIRDQRFCVHVRDLGLKSYFSVGRNGLRPQFGDHADVTFTASAKDFTRLALRLEDPDTLFFNRRLLIEGNTDLGLTVKNMLDGIEFDSLLAALPAPLAFIMRTLRQRMSDEPDQVAFSSH